MNLLLHLPFKKVYDLWSLVRVWSQFMLIMEPEGSLAMNMNHVTIFDYFSKSKWNIYWDKN